LEDVHWRQRLINDLRKCTVLILDDLGSESVTSWTRDEILFPLLDERMQKGLKTYFTSNYDLKGLEEHYQKDRQQVAAMRLMERISTLSDAVMVPGPSRRK
jgi:primosomal protein DnaI